MATKKVNVETEEIITNENPKLNPMDELVPFRAFKDNDKYKDDIFVSVNEKSYMIKRGETVMIPKNVALVLERAERQKAYSANMEDAMVDEYAAETRLRGI